MIGIFLVVVILALIMALIFFTILAAYRYVRMTFKSKHENRNNTIGYY